MQKAENRRAIAAGLTFRPLADTVRDTLAWLESGAKARGEDWEHGPVGLTPERETELLEAVAA
jgi:2'-hydroxyisoflavone reductase